MRYEDVLFERVEIEDDDSTTLVLFRFGPSNTAFSWDQKSPIACDFSAVVENALRAAESELGMPVVLVSLSLNSIRGFAVFTANCSSELEDEDGLPYDCQVVLDVNGNELHGEEIKFASFDAYERNPPDIGYLADV